MKDLLKEAIVEAKAVRETALANAKLALEEAFAPRLQSIISAKMNEMEEEEDQEEDVIEEPVEAAEEMPAEETPEAEESEEDFDFEEEEEMDDDSELDEIIRELESEEEAEMAEPELEEAEDEEVDLEEIMNSLQEEDMDSEEEIEEMEAADDEEIDLDEIVSSLREEDEEAEVEETEDHSEELEEAYSVITYLKSKLNEVNLLNAKLLYSNKLFKSFNLNDTQKMKVIENFDRANTMREIKLIYTTLTESFKLPASKKVVKEGFASKPVASTKPKASVLTEGNELAARFQKLAGLL